MSGYKNTQLCFASVVRDHKNFECLATETVESLALTLQSVDNVHSCHGLTTGVFGVCDGITNHVFKENLQYTTSFFVDQTRDTLDTTTTGQTTNGGFGNTLDVITKDLSVTLGASLLCSARIEFN